MAAFKATLMHMQATFTEGKKLAGYEVNVFMDREQATAWCGK